MTLHAENYGELRQYLLGDLTDEARRRAEERLMTEPGFLEELLLAEEELIDDYVGDGLSAGERLKFEHHFLCTPERRRQLRFARSLSRYVSESTKKIVGPEPQPALAPPPAPGLSERLRAFLGLAFVPRAALALLSLAVIGVALWFVIPPRQNSRPGPPQTFAALTLAAGAGERAGGAQAARVQVPLKEDALRISLELPGGAPSAARYRVELEDDRRRGESFDATARDAHSVSVDIPAARLAPGEYVLKLFAAEAGGAEQRVQGGIYRFTAEPR